MMGEMVDGLIQRRQRMMRWYLLGGPVFMIGMMGQELMKSFLPFGIVEVIGGIVFAVSIVQLRSIQRTMRQNPRVASIMNDELTEQQRVRSAWIALGAVGTTQFVFMLVLSFVPNLVSGLIVAQVTTLVLSTAFVASFLKWDLK